jgi:hypothetical protein
VLRIRIRDPLPFWPLNPGTGMEKIRIRDPGRNKFGSGINIPDPQHWKNFFRPLGPGEMFLLWRGIEELAARGRPLGWARQVPAKHRKFYSFLSLSSVFRVELCLIVCSVTKPPLDIVGLQNHSSFNYLIWISAHLVCICSSLLEKFVWKLCSFLWSIRIPAH